MVCVIDFYDGNHRCSAWGRIQRMTRILEFFYDENRIDEANILKRKIKDELIKFQKTYKNYTFNNI